MYVPDVQLAASESATMALPLAPFLSRVAQPFARLFNLPHLPDHFPTLFYAFLVFTALHLFISPFLSARIFPISYGKLRNKRAVNQWCVASHISPTCSLPERGALPGTSRLSRSSMSS